MLDIITIGNDILRIKTAPVENIDGELATIIDQMRLTMINGNGIGLAAPQVAIDGRFFVCMPEKGDFLVFINPEIVQTSESLSTYEEGCLSIPGVYADVVRPGSITVQARDINGKPFTLEANDILARVIQHEYDHLDGILFPDRLSDRKREKVISQYDKLCAKKTK